MKPVYGFIFDLDGVITDTAEYHYLAWKALATELNLKFDRHLNERLKGVSRIRSLEIILEYNLAHNRFSLGEKLTLTEKKNAIYVEMIKHITKKDILPGIETFIQAAKQHGHKIALASASLNARDVLSYLELTHVFDYIADADKVKSPKPAPDIFIDCAQKLGISPIYCMGIEDSDAGITAIKDAKMYAIGINVIRESEASYVPNYYVNDTETLLYDEVIVAFDEYLAKEKTRQLLLEQAI